MAGNGGGGSKQVRVAVILCTYIQEVSGSSPGQDTDKSD